MKNITYEILDIPIAKPIKYKNKSIEEVIWLNKKYNSFNTHKDMKVLRKDKELPHGFGLYTIPNQIDQKLVLKIFEKLFKKFRGSEWMYNYKINETLFVKDNPKKNPRTIQYSFDYIIKLLKKDDNNSQIIKVLTYYFNEAMKVLNVHHIKDAKLYNKLKSSCCFSILHYKGNSGLHCHVDNLTGGDGPIVTIGVGSDFYYDIRPIFYNEKELETLKPIRISVKSNQIGVMDGEMRYCWQHCIPFGYKRIVDKYTIKIMFPKFRKYNPVYNSFFDTTFTTSY